jgi:DNA-binding winged helix-turn-helix (wHTH) protein
MDTGVVLKLASRENPGQNSGGDQNQKVAKAETGCLCFGEFQLDLKQQHLFKDGLQIRVQGKVLLALVTLIERPGEIVSRETLRTRLWPRDTHLNYDANVNTTVNKLRQVLGDTNEESKFIGTVPRRGYSFVAKVDYVERPAVTSTSKSRAASGRRPSLWSFARVPEFLNSDHARIWFTASVIAWVMAAVLFGAAVTLFSHRSARGEMLSHPADTKQPVSKP